MCDSSFSSLSPSGGTILASLASLLSGLLTYALIRGYRARSFFYRRLVQQGLPMPPWSPFLGHLLALSPVVDQLPKDTQRPDAFEILCKAHQGDGDSVIYLDLWPFTAVPLMIICSPTLAVQACQEHDLDKPDTLHEFFDPLAGGHNLFTMNGPEWKRSRALFNPGFSPSYLLQQQTGHIVDEAEVYVSKLRDHALRGDMFSLDELTCWYTMDIIGAVTLDSRLQSQTQFNALASALRRQVNWHVTSNELNIFIRWNPALPLVQAYNSWQMNRYISQELDKRYAEWCADESDNVTSSSRSIIHIVLAGYMAQQRHSKGARPRKLDPAFKKWATTQIRLFLFAGHDSTSSTICYIFYLLQSNPEAFVKIRAEHDAVFGDAGSLATVPDQLRQNPSSLNQLPYTTAVIKETLRLFPPASAFRDGRAGVFLTDAKGNKYPTEGTNLWVLHSAVQRNEKYWPEPLAFRPERWLGAGADSIPRGGWRPFEHGPRNCLGQTLAMLDLKITLVLTVREFEVRHAYDEWDRLHNPAGIKTVNGERAYQMQTGGAHPADGFPCRVRLRTVSGSKE